MGIQGKRTSGCLVIESREEGKKIREVFMKERVF